METTRDSTWFRIPGLGRYFRWLESGSPVGGVDRYPVVAESGETNVPGIFVAGDLTGVPLLKLAANGGAAVVRRLVDDPGFAGEREVKEDGALDLVIVGAGIAGLSAALEAREAGLDFVVLEGDRSFTTIRNFPAGKPIVIYPLEAPLESGLDVDGETKEELLAKLDASVDWRELPLETGKSVVAVDGKRGAFTVRTKGGDHRSLRVLIAVGKTGESSKLGVPGEELPKVLNRLIDPLAFAGQRVLVVGGGDSALEAAMLLAAVEGTEVTLSYRGPFLSRPKPENIRRVNEAAEAGRLTLLLSSSVREVQEREVVLAVEGEEAPRLLPNDTVFTLIGHKLPLDLLEGAGLTIEAAWSRARVVMFAALLFFSGMLYFGKSSGEALRVAGWLSAIGFAVTGAMTLGLLASRARVIFGTGWGAFKNIYLLGVALLVLWVYVADRHMGAPLAGKGMGYWYTLLYSLTIAVFGLRRILARRSRYITVQTSVLIGVQVLFLFLLPEHILPWMDARGMIGPWALENLFPGGSYWRSYGFVLAWPLFFSNLLYGQPTTVWLVISIAQSFVLIPLIVWRFGKGAYCGWLCSCGGLAETLGDEYRTLAHHGPRARSLEHAGQLILIVVAVLSLWNLLAPGTLGAALDSSRKAYKVLVDVGLAGVVGVGFYFFYSGRVWCRFFCPLAALMHIYTRFSVYRIFADKKKCISCGLCTRTCHMGIDVMNYANKGRPMDDYQCVRCSACVYSCPVSCLNFGRMKGRAQHPTTFGLREERPEYLVQTGSSGSGR